MPFIPRMNNYRARVSDSTTVVLQYHRESDDLCVWPWPSSTKARIAPSAMQDHRISHRMLGPCCLCPMMDESNPDFVEAAIYKASNGDQMGEYIAACAKDKCGYVAPLESLYDKQGPVRCYARRGKWFLNDKAASSVTILVDAGERVPPNVTPQIRLIPTGSRCTKSDISSDAIPWRRPPTLRASRKTTELLAKLDARDRPGVSESEFRTLFSKCECGRYMTRRAFKDHYCWSEVAEPACGQ